jgi:CRP/FNR family transcriptional activator FtrB
MHTPSYRYCAGWSEIHEMNFPYTLTTNVRRPTTDLLREIPIFQDLEEAVRSRVAEVAELLSVPQDTVLCRQGEPADRLYILCKGQVALSNTAANGSNAVVEVVSPGGYFVLSTVLAGLPLLMSAHTATPSELVVVEAAGLLALLAEEPTLATSLMRAEAMDFQALVRQVCDLKLRTTAQRLGCYLLELSRDSLAGPATLRLPFDKRLLAARLGCRQENLSRAFAALRSFGVETHGARVILHDIPSLRAYAEPDELDRAPQPA